MHVRPGVLVLLETAQWAYGFRVLVGFIVWRMSLSGWAALGFCA